MPEARPYQRKDGSCPFDERFNQLGDPRAAARVDTTVRKLARGLRPDVRSVGGGVQESRIDHGPGYRVYFGEDADNIVVLLCGGDKDSQSRDIKNAKEYWKDYKNNG